MKRCSQPLTEAQYAVLVECSPTMVWRTGPDGGLDYFNQTWLSFTGRPLAEEQGDGWLAGVHPDDGGRWTRTFREAIARRVRFEIEFRLRWSDGAYRWVAARGAPFADEQGEYAGFVGSCVDVDEAKQAEWRAREASVEGERARLLAERSLRARDEFLVMAAHELRTPLTTLPLQVGSAQKLLAGGQPGAESRVAARPGPS